MHRWGEALCSSFLSAPGYGAQVTPIPPSSSFANQTEAIGGTPSPEDAFIAVARALETQADLLVIQAAALRSQAVALRCLRVSQFAAPSTVGPLVNKPEIARVLDVSVATVDRHDRDGQPYIRVGEVKRYDVAEVLPWHAARTNEQPAKASTEVSSANDSGARRLTRSRRVS